MVSHYKTQMIVFQDIDKRLIKISNNKNSESINSMILDYTKRFPISGRAVEKRINSFVQEHNDILQIIDGVVFFYDDNRI